MLWPIYMFILHNYPLKWTQEAPNKWCINLLNLISKAISYRVSKETIMMLFSDPMAEGRSDYHDIWPLRSGDQGGCTHVHYPSDHQPSRDVWRRKLQAHRQQCLWTTQCHCLSDRQPWVTHNSIIHQPPWLKVVTSSYHQTVYSR